VGKTSLGKSIAKATGREFIRMSLVVCAMRPRSAATPHPTSARCPQGHPVDEEGEEVQTPLFVMDEIDKKMDSAIGDMTSAAIRPAALS